MVDLPDNVRTGIFQLDLRGRVVMANDMALALLRKGHGLCDRDGVLRAVLPKEDVRLQELVVQALRFLGGIGASGSMRLIRAGSLPPLVLYVSPVYDPNRESGRRCMGAVVLTVDPTERWNLDTERVANLLGLTRAESHIAVLLAQGMSIDEVATEVERSRTTIKWHIRNIYAKHGLSRPGRADAAGELAGGLFGGAAMRPPAPNSSSRPPTAPTSIPSNLLSQSSRQGSEKPPRDLSTASGTPLGKFPDLLPARMQKLLQCRWIYRSMIGFRSSRLLKNPSFAGVSMDLVGFFGSLTLRPGFAARSR